MSGPITRREFLTLEALIAGASPLLAMEAVASIGLSHEKGWLDVMVNPKTGEPAS